MIKKQQVKGRTKKDENKQKIKKNKRIKEKDNIYIT